jgi:hypothetical protein
LCRGGGGGGGGLAVFGNGQNGFLPLRLRRLLSRGEAAPAAGGRWIFRQERGEKSCQGEKETGRSDET